MTTCAVCKTNPEVHVISSAVGPMSFPTCLTCLPHNSEPESSFIFLYEISDDGEGVAEHINDLTTYKDGKYIGWAEWRDNQRVEKGLVPLKEKDNDKMV